MFKLALVLSAIGLAAAQPLSYVNGPAPGQIAAPAQQQVRYVQQPAGSIYQPQQQGQQQTIYQPQPPPQRKLVRPQQQEEEYEPPQPYNFAFDVRDDQFTNYQNRQEAREGDTVKGSYSVVDSDGFIRTVKYTADPLSGFQAEVSREPTDIKVIIPTQAPSIRQQQTAQYLDGAQRYQAQQPQVYSSLSNPNQYRAAAPAKPAARQQYAVAQPAAAQPQLFHAAQAAPAQQQVQYVSAPAARAKAYQPVQYQGYPQQ